MKHLLSIFRKKELTVLAPMSTVTFVPKRPTTTKNELVPRFHGAIVRYWDSFNSELYNRIINAKNAE